MQKKNELPQMFGNLSFGCAPHVCVQRDDRVSFQLLVGKKLFQLLVPCRNLIKRGLCKTDIMEKNTSNETLNHTAMEVLYKTSIVFPVCTLQAFKLVASFVVFGSTTTTLVCYMLHRALGL